MSVREIIKNKKYKIELFIGRNGSKKIMHYEIVEGGKKEAELRESELKLQIRNHTFVKNNKKTVKDLMNEYIEYNFDKWSPKTYESNVHWINDNINKSIGHVYLQDLNVKILESFYKELKKHKYSDKTIQHHYVLINGALNRAIKWDYINYNVNQKIEKPKIRKKEIECYSKDDVIKLLSVLENECLKYQSIILLALDSGIRRGELTGLTWNDIDFKNKSIKINKTTQYTKDLGIFEKSTKSQNSDRIIYISDKTINILKQYRKEQLQNKMKLGNKWGNSLRVFPTEDGNDIHPDTPSYIFRKIIKKYNLKKISFHGLRHTSASLLISQGIQHQIISRRLGHSNVSVTDSIYSHFFDDEFKEVANKMDSVLNTKIS